MARPPKTPSIQGQYFTWRLFRRSGVWYADGRGSGHTLGKHSLGTRDRAEALQALSELDLRIAIGQGLASPTQDKTEKIVSIQEGWELYLTHCERPIVMGGVRPRTLKRYRAVRDKHSAFCRSRTIPTWNEIDRREVEKYGHFLSKEGYAYRTQYLELTTIKSVLGWLIRSGYLPDSARFELELKRPEGTDTYCYTQEEVRAMVALCRAEEKLHWLGNVIVAVASTGMRIGELATLRRSDLDLSAGLIRLKDESAQSHRAGSREIRTTKGGRGRTIPIHAAFREVIESLPPHSDGRLLHGPRGGKLKPDTVRSVLIREVITPLASQFPSPPGERGFADGRVHSFRHYFVSQAFLSGVGEGEIMTWVGHRDSKMVAHYRHLGNADARRKMNQIDFLGERSASDGPLAQAS